MRRPTDRVFHCGHPSTSRGPRRHPSRAIGAREPPLLPVPVNNSICLHRLNLPHHLRRRSGRSRLRCHQRSITRPRLSRWVGSSGCHTGGRGDASISSSFSLRPSSPGTGGAGSWSVIRAAGSGDLRPVPPTGLLDRELERGRLAAVRGGGQFGAVAARAEQGRDAGVHGSSDWESIGRSRWAVQSSLASNKRIRDPLG